MAAKFRWWKAPKGKVWSALIPTIHALEQDLQLDTYYTSWINKMQNRSYGGLTPGHIKSGKSPIFRKSDHQVKGRAPVAINATANIAEALQARVCSDQVRVRVLTVGGDYSARRRAQKTDRAIAGIWHEQDAYGAGELAYRDCQAVGLGHMKYAEDYASERVIVERLVPGEVLWDEDACPNGKPKIRYQRKWVAAESLAARYPKFASQIAKAASSGDAGENRVPPADMVATDLVYVCEAWQCPPWDTDPDDRRAPHGRHVISINGADLLVEKWCDKFDPISTIAFIPAFVGAQGQGLVEYLEPLSDELQAAARKVQGALQVGSVNRTYYEEGMLVDEKQLTNRPGDVVKLRAGGIGKVKTDTPNALSGQAIMYPDWILRIMHESSGMSKMSASGVKPAEVEAAVAMRELHDIEGMRYGLHHRRNERFWCHGADLTMRAGRRLNRYLKKQKDERKFMIQVPNKSVLWEVDFDETLKDADKYLVQTWPSNLLPSTPGAKLATVLEMLQRQLINQQVALALMNFPDLEVMQSLYASEIDLVDWQVEQILDGKSADEVQLRSFQTYQVVILRSGQQARQAVLDGAPEDRIAELEKYIAGATARAKKVQETQAALQAMQQAQQQGPPAGGPPISIPGAAPGGPKPAGG